MPQARSQFVISSWDYLDDYGQGLYSIGIYENSTGSWLLEATIYHTTKNVTLDWFVNASIRLNLVTLFNSCITNADNFTHGQQFQRHNVTVTRTLQGQRTVYSQDNFTYSSSQLDSGFIWIYQYYAVLNFEIVYGVVYTITVNYDVYYMEGI